MTSRIPTRSKRQAMDWSLVLISQGIESWLDHTDEAGWGLLVSSEEVERALVALRQYKVENRRWPWRKEIRQTFVFDWASLGWVFLLLLFFWFQQIRPEITDAGLMDSAAVSHGQWWRLFTAIFLHANIAHLASNAGIGLVLLGLVMGLYGTGIGLLAAFLAGAGGNVAAWLLFNQHRSLGASGMVMACVGLLTVHSLALISKDRREWKSLLATFAAGVMLFALMGLDPQADVLAHLGGFVAGIMLGAALATFPRLMQKPVANAIAGLLFVAVTVLAWWCALRGSG